MSKIMQNLVVFMDLSEHAWDTPLKSRNMILNRFCIDEDAAFELSGVYYLKKSSQKIAGHIKSEDSLEFKLKRKQKGKEYGGYPF